MVSLTIENVSKNFGAVAAVDGVSIDIAKGEFFFLLGPSGCGKTTLLRMVAGFYEPDGGEIRFDARVINAVPPHKRNTGMVFQNYALWPHMTVWQNVSYGLELRKLDKAAVKRRVGRALELVRLTGLEQRRPNALSGGQQQRVALARALVIEPDVLLLDEPLSNLDAKLRIEMRHELRRIHAETGITTLYVTHDQKEALSLAGRMAVMCNGRVEQVGAPREVYLKPANRFVAEFIGQANVLPGVATDGEGGLATIRTDYGQLRAPTDARGKVLCCVRPEALRLSDAAANALKATVADVTYLGEQEEILLRLEAPNAEARQLLLVLPHPKGRSMQPGDRITAGFDPEDVIVIPG